MKSGQLVAWGLSLLFLVSSIGITWWHLSHAKPQFVGKILDVYEEGQYITSYLLESLNKSVITIGKLCDIALPNLKDEQVLARIVAHKSDGDSDVVMLEVLDPLHAEQVLESRPLTDGQELTFGPYQLRFQSIDLVTEQLNDNKEILSHV